MQQASMEGAVARLRPHAPRERMAAEGAGERDPSGEEKSDAYHEAGHAVIARVLSLVSGGIWLGEEVEETGGVTVADPWLILDSWEERRKFRTEFCALRGRIIAYMAGRESELAFLGTCRRRDDGDHDEIAAMLDELPIPLSGRSLRADLDRYGERLRRRTRALVRRHGGKIHRLAAEVLERGSLRPHEIDAILARM